MLARAAKILAAYAALAQKVISQWHAMEAAGLVVEMMEVGQADVYGNPRNAILDLANNNQLYIFPAERTRDI